MCEPPPGAGDPASGGAVLVGGLVWFLTIPSASSSRGAMVTPYVSFDGAGLAAVGRF